MLNSSENLPVDVFIMLPSCVPATIFENSGARLTAEDLEPFYSHPRVLGLAEVMDFPSIVNLNEEMLKKIVNAKSNGSIIDGHAAGLSKEELNGEIDKEVFKGNESNKELALKLPKINMKEFRKDDLEIHLSSDLCNVIERHHSTGNIGLGIVKGFGIKNGAIATSVAHDSHNIVVVGTSDEEMFMAVNQLKKINGGIAITKDKEVIAELPLAIGGLMSENGYLEIQKQLHVLNDALSIIGLDKGFNPFFTLSFLTLPVIPEIKLTDMGLFEFKTFSHIKVEEQSRE